MANPNVTRFAALARRAGARYGVDPALLLADIEQESGGREATSSAGARGITQFIPSTAREYGVKYGTSRAAVESQVFGQAKYLASLGARRDPKSALEAYLGEHGPQGRAYAASVLAKVGGYRGAAGAATGTPGAPGGAQTVPGVLSAQQTESGGTGPSTAALQEILDAVKQQSGPALGSPAAPVVAAKPILAGLGSGTPAPLQRKQPDLAGLVEQALGAQQPNVSSSVTSSGPTSIPGAEGGHAGQAGAASTGGTADFAGKRVAKWIAPILEYARQQGWKGGVNSGFRSLGEQTRIYNSGVRPAAKPGTSNHEFTVFPGGAVDVSEAQQLANILRRSPYAGKLQWAGSKDPVHFSHPHNGSY